MKKIEKLDIKEYQVPTNLETRGEDRGFSETGIIDHMLDKLDELVFRVNELTVMVVPEPPKPMTSRSPRLRYLPKGEGEPKLGMENLLYVPNGTEH